MLYTIRHNKKCKLLPGNKSYALIVPMPTAVILGNSPQPSFKIIGDLFIKNFQEAGVTVIERGVPATAEECTILAKEFACTDAVFFHNTAGYSFQIIPGARNIALPAYEFSKFPEPWVKLLNNYDEIWITTRHVGRIMASSGITRPIFKLPPALDRDARPRKTTYAAHYPFRFLFVGEPHFRKGVHFLMYGFVKAFPTPGQAELVIKTSSCKDWAPLRSDIKFITERLSRDELLRLYAGSDCYISASLAEGLGLPLAEAALMGLPVCANNWGGHQDLLVSGGYFSLKFVEAARPWTGPPQFYTPGQKCAFSDENSVAAAMLKIVKSSALQRQRLAEKAHAHIIKKYGAETLKPLWQKQVNRLWHKI